jgi:hypothetical protein
MVTGVTIVALIDAVALTWAIVFEVLNAERKRTTEKRTREKRCIEEKAVVFLSLIV